MVALMGLTAQAEIVDGIVATVGPEVILQSDLVQELRPALASLQKTATSREAFNEAVDAKMREALDQAIDSKILLREAQLAGLDIPESAIEERIADYRKMFSSNEEFLKELEKAGETMSDLRTRIKKQIMAGAYGLRKRREFEKAAEVTEADLRKYYDENQSKFAHGERLRLRRIFIAADKGADGAAKAKAAIEDVAQKLKGGADFAELAKVSSGGPEAEQGGLMGWVARNDLVKEIEDQVFALQEGAVTEPIKTEFGYALFKCEKKENSGSASFDAARKDIEPEVRAQMGAEKYKKWIGELRKRARVRVFSLVTEH